MDAIKDIIAKVIAPLSEGRLDVSHIMEQWQRLGAGKSKAESFKDGCLTVNVDCAARRLKMELQKDELLKALNKTHPDIKTIRFKVGKIS